MSTDSYYSVGVTARQRRLQSSAAASLTACCSSPTAVTPRPSLCASALFLKSISFKRANSKRAPRATGVFLKMASRSCVSGCGRFLASSDGHDRCISCLGFQHAEAALVDDSCSLCGNMTIAVLRSRYLLVKRGGIPLVMPRSSSSGSRRATSAHGQGDWGSQWELPRRVRLRGSLTPLAHRTVWGFRTSLWSPRTGRGPASRSELQQMTGCRSLHRGMS